MKKSVMLLFLICCNVSFSQIGKVYLKDSVFKIGKENTYIYEIPNGTEIPKEAKIRVVYNNNFDFSGGSASLIKKANKYEFTIQVPDSTKYFIAVVVEGSKVVDNNKNSGYDVFLDTWERGKEKETTEKVTQFINDKKYSFNVLFDYDDAITTKYKIEGIPTKILIDKNVSVIKFGASESDLINLIEQQLSL